MNRCIFASLIIPMALSLSCADDQIAFSESNRTSEAELQDEPAIELERELLGSQLPVVEVGESEPDVVILDPECATDLSVSGQANPWLAGMPDGTTISKTGDRAPAQSPINVVFKSVSCLDAGTRLMFSSSGQASHGKLGYIGVNGHVNRDSIIHREGAIYGKSNIYAPFASLLGVFLSDSQTSQGVPPTLEFNTAAKRNFTELEPMLNQIFFIGDGLTDSGEAQHFVVPEGATTFYLGMMDRYEWRNNSGSFQVSVTRDIGE